MINILIVDDNQNNRMILKFLLEDYTEEKDEENLFDIREVEDGALAVKACEDKMPDIIFMDIMMPNMDGIEATKIIKNKYKKVLIIAVSAVDDDERKKLILHNGAEDYVSKPINGAIFSARLENYLSLANNRKVTNEPIEPEAKVLGFAHNVYTKDVFAHQVIFYIGNDDALSEFWEYYLLGEHKEYEDLSDIVRSAYAIASLHLKLEHICRIVIEESEKNMYFSVGGFDKKDEQIIKLIMAKNSQVRNWRFKNGTFSAFIEKVEVITEEIKVSTAENIFEEEQVEEVKEVEIDTSSTWGDELHVFNFLDPFDLEELDDRIGQLSSMLLQVGSSAPTEEEAREIADLLDKIGRTLSGYTETFIIGQALQGFSQDITTNIETFLEQAKALGTMFQAFSNDITTWKEMMFETGAPSVSFMDETIVVNVQTITSMIKVDDTVDENADDIFDF